jgi:light-independent protochlorophyllide reductase subunit B
MFRDDFDGSDGAGASHLGHATAAPKHDAPVSAVPEPIDAEEAAAEISNWTAEAEKELKKIPFFVRGKARRNTERYAMEQGLTAITLETLYDAKAHYAR